MKYLLILILMIVLSGCHTSSSHGTATNHDTAIADAISKCAMKVFSLDWIGYDEALTNEFSSAELAVLQSNRSNVTEMVELALEQRQDSVWGAKLAVDLGLVSLLPLLRDRFFEPKHCYGWEGPDYSKIESYLSDCQFQYSMAYLEAIEKMTGKPIHKAVAPTKDEMIGIANLAANKDSEFYQWALWIQRKLKIKKEPNQISHRTVAPRRVNVR
jgi:hypothetical protein